MKTHTFGTGQYYLLGSSEPMKGMKKGDLNCGKYKLNFNEDMIIAVVIVI